MLSEQFGILVDVKVNVEINSEVDQIPNSGENTDLKTKVIKARLFDKVRWLRVTDDNAWDRYLVSEVGTGVVYLVDPERVVHIHSSLFESDARV